MTDSERPECAWCEAVAMGFASPDPGWSAENYSCGAEGHGFAFRSDSSLLEGWLVAHDAEVARAAAEKAWKQGAQWAAVECGAIDRVENLWVTDDENPYRLEQNDE